MEKLFRLHNFDNQQEIIVDITQQCHQYCNIFYINNFSELKSDNDAQLLKMLINDYKNLNLSTQELSALTFYFFNDYAINLDDDNQEKQISLLLGDLLGEMNVNPQEAQLWLKEAFLYAQK